MKVIKEKRFFLVFIIFIITWGVWHMVLFAQQQQKAFWDTDLLTNSETVYRLGGGLFVKAKPAEVKYQMDGIHIIWQLNQIFRGQVITVVWKEVSNWDLNKKEFVVVRKEAYTKTTNPQVSINEFSPVSVKKDTVNAKGEEK